MADRCTGECCKAFFLPFTHEDHRKSLTERVDRQSDEIFFNGEWRRVIDGEMILAMIVPLPELENTQYTCRHFDGANCKAYELRPEMCQEFPYGKPCEHREKCQWTAGQTGTHQALVQLEAPEKTGT